MKKTTNGAADAAAEPKQPTCIYEVESYGPITGRYYRFACPLPAGHGAHKAYCRRHARALGFHVQEAIDAR